MDPSYPDSHLRSLDVKQLSDSLSAAVGVRVVLTCAARVEIGKVGLRFSACCPGSGDSRKPEVSTHADRPDLTIIAKIYRFVVRFAYFRGSWVAK